MNELRAWWKESSSIILGVIAVAVGVIAALLAMGLIISWAEPQSVKLQRELTEQALLFNLAETRQHGPLVTDTCLYHALLVDCLREAKRGPEVLTAAGNDGDEVIEACREAAVSGSRRRAAGVREECR